MFRLKSVRKLEKRDKKLEKRNKMKNSDVRSIAKAGMTLSLAALIVTGATMRGNHHNRHIHTWAGVALVGFSVWHYNVYQKA